MNVNEFQNWLDHTGVSLLGNDVASYQKFIECPFTLVTCDGNAELTTREQVVDLLGSYQSMFENLHITSLIRLAKTTRALDDDRIEGTYVSHVFSESHRVFPPFPSTMILRKSNGLWRAVSVTNHLTNNRWPLPPPGVSKPNIDKGISV